MILQSKITRYLNNIDIIKNLDEKRFKQVNFNDMFEIVKPRKVFDINNSENGDIPLYDTGKDLNIAKYINDYSYNNKNKDVLIALTFDGNCNICKDKKFAIRGHNSMTIFKLKTNLEHINLNCKLVSYQLNPLFSWSNQITLDKIDDLKLYLYI